MFYYINKFFDTKTLNFLIKTTCALKYYLTLSAMKFISTVLIFYNYLIFPQRTRTALNAKN